MQHKVETERSSSNAWRGQQNVGMKRATAAGEDEGSSTGGSGGGRRMAYMYNRWQEMDGITIHKEECRR